MLSSIAVQVPGIHASKAHRDHMTTRSLEHRDRGNYLGKIFTIDPWGSTDSSNIHDETPISIKDETAGVKSLWNTLTDGETVDTTSAMTLVEDNQSLGNDIAQDRIKLLVQKYQNPSDYSEISARLEILGNELLKHSPRVTIGQVIALENTKQLMVKAAAEISSIFERYNVVE